MNSETKEIFCLDANVFIFMHRFYPMQHIPDLWTLLADLFHEHKIISHRYVYDEIIPFQDGLSQWLVNFKPYFLPISLRQTELVKDVLKNFPKLINHNYEKNQADPWLIALLLELMEKDGMFGDHSKYVLVTNENSSSTIKLPAACRFYNIRHMDLWQFFTANGFRFSVSRS